MIIALGILAIIIGIIGFFVSMYTWAQQEANDASKARAKRQAQQDQTSANRLFKDIKTQQNQRPDLNFGAGMLYVNGNQVGGWLGVKVSNSTTHTEQAVVNWAIEELKALGPPIGGNAQSRVVRLVL